MSLVLRNKLNKMFKGESLNETEAEEVDKVAFFNRCLASLEKRYGGVDKINKELLSKDFKAALKHAGHDGKSKTLSREQLGKVAEYLDGLGEVSESLADPNPDSIASPLRLRNWLDGQIHARIEEVIEKAKDIGDEGKYNLDGYIDWMHEMLVMIMKKPIGDLISLKEVTDA
jgi:hypothetical protein